MKQLLIILTLAIVATTFASASSSIGKEKSNHSHLSIVKDSQANKKMADIKKIIRKIKGRKLLASAK